MVSEYRCVVCTSLIEGDLIDAGGEFNHPLCYWRAKATRGSAALAAAQAEIAALRKALLEYGGHTGNCYWGGPRGAENKHNPGYHCECGLDALLAPEPQGSRGGEG